MSNSNDTRTAALQAIGAGETEAAIACAILYLGDRINEGVIDLDTTTALEQIGVELGGIGQVLSA